MGRVTERKSRKYDKPKDCRDKRPWEHQDEKSRDHDDQNSWDHDDHRKPKDCQLKIRFHCDDSVLLYSDDFCVCLMKCPPCEPGLYCAKVDSCGVNWVPCPEPLAGPTGPQGPTGPTGMTNPKGIHIMTNPKGIQSLTGPTGPEGIQVNQETKA